MALLPTALGCDSAYETKQGKGGGTSYGAGGTELTSSASGGTDTSSSESGGTTSGGTTPVVSGGTTIAVGGSTLSTVAGEGGIFTLGSGGTPQSGGKTSTTPGGTAAKGGATSTTAGGTTAKGGTTSTTTGGTTTKGGTTSTTTGGTTAEAGTTSTSTGGVSATAGAPPTVAGAAGNQAASSAVVYGEIHSGQYHLGPVDFAETEWTNACSPYPSSLFTASGLGGEYLAGVSNSYAQAGGVCDACIFVSTAAGKQITARVVTFGATNQPGDIDVSPSVYAALNTGEYPRTMTWQFAKCPATGTLYYQFQTEANEWWTSLWVRNPRVPVTKVEVKSTNHADFVALERGTDGTLTDGGGFGTGSFTLRITAMDGQVIADTFSSFSPGQIIQSTKQFQ